LHNNFATFDFECGERQQSALPPSWAKSSFSLISQGHFRASNLARRL
jgi:hypothetical protein